MNIIPLDSKHEFGYRPAITVGMFDGVHIGHQKLLQRLKTRAEELGTKPIIITFNKHPRLVLEEEWGESAIKLLQTTEERFEKLFSLGFEHIVSIDFTPEFAKKSAKDFLELLIDKYSIQYLLLGYDNSFGKRTNNEFEEMLDIAKASDLIIERSDICEHYGDIRVSSTQVRKALERGNIADAKAMLGGSYIFNGRVVEGNKIGRTLGFPTANFHIDKHKLLPRFGVYAVRVDIDGVMHKGVLNIGIRPTIHNSPVVLETHILGFDSDIYNKTIRIHFEEFIRPEIRFDSLEELKKEIGLDIERAKEILSI